MMFRVREVRTVSHSILRKFSSLIVAGILTLALIAPQVDAAEFWLRADTTTLTMPDGAVISMWGYAEDADQNLATHDGTVTVPGPSIVVAPGDTTVTINLLNNLPVPSSLMIAGQPSDGSVPTFVDGRVLSMTDEAAGNGGIVTYTWSNLRPGTYLYSSGTDPAVQVQMGLYGSVKADVVDGPLCSPEPGGGTCYRDIVYDEDLTLLFSEIDPAVHQAVATDNYGPSKAMTSTIEYQPKYFLINGVARSAGDAPIEIGTGGDRLLIRFLNAGLRTVVPVIQGFYVNIVAEDGFPTRYPQEQYSVFLPAGKTHDAIFSLRCDDLPEPILSHGKFAIYDRMGRLNNAGAPGEGGMMVEFNLVDLDGESIADICDNCTGVANANQLDTDGDLFGNVCDADFNNDLFVDFADVAPMIRGFIWQDPNADLNADGVVNFGDIQVFVDSYDKPPGPSALN